MSTASFLLALSVSTALTANPPDVATFRSAQPIWPQGRETEKNLFVGFRASFYTPIIFRVAERTRAPVVLRVAAHCAYRAFVNGEYVGCGPARAGHGYYRVDEWDLTDRLVAVERLDRNIVAIEVAGYNVNSFDLLDLPSFVQAEIVASGAAPNGAAAVVASTQPHDRDVKGLRFTAGILDERVQKTRRYSFQRPFSEVYRLRADHAAWRRRIDAPLGPVACALTEPKALLPRRVPYPTFRLRPAVRDVSADVVRVDPKTRPKWRDRALTAIGPKLGGFPEAELEAVPTKVLQQVVTIERKPVDRPLTPQSRWTLGAGSRRVLDLGTNLTGFIGAHVECAEKTRFLVVFDEILSPQGDVDFKRLACANVVEWNLVPGTYDLESFAPYTARYLALLVLEGRCEVSDVHLREYVNPDVWEAHFASSDPRLSWLFDAGRETYAQNAVDVFMDCPSRERAGWLCDSFFTARAALDLGGDTVVEQNFFENFLLPESFKHLPDGMLPMCYPADHYDGVFIPNWALWFVVELEEYAARSGDRRMVAALEKKVMRLFEYFRPFRNSDGLLEKLEGWVFVEWSAANRFVQDVNYPSNMLFAGALDAAARMYGRAELAKDAAKIRDTIRKQSWNGRFFRDHAVRNGNELKILDDQTEVCQYFAFFFGLATPKSHPELWKKLVDDFGPDRAKTGAHASVHAANSFIGNMLRFEILSRYGHGQQILDESIGYLLYMADRTGTLWENVQPHASCNHGFASHIVHTLYRDVLGAYEIDSVRKRIVLRFSDLKLDWCEGHIPRPGGAVSLRWRRDGKRLLWRLDAPAGYTIEVDNRTGLELVRQ